MSTISCNALRDADIEKSNESKINHTEALRISLVNFKEYSEILRYFIEKNYNRAINKAYNEEDSEEKAHNYSLIETGFFNLNKKYFALFNKIDYYTDIVSVNLNHEEFEELKNLVEGINLEGMDMESDKYIQCVKNTKAIIIKALDTLETLGEHALQIQQQMHSIKKLLLITLLTAAFMPLIIMYAPAILVAVAPAIPVAGAVKGATIGVVGVEAATICHKYNQYRKKVRVISSSKLKEDAIKLFPGF